MILAIVGSRGFNDYKLLSDHVRLYKPSLIVSGGARGADKLAEQYAKEHNIEMLIIKPEWDLYGNEAGFRRNIDIINHADSVIAFWDGESKGTKHSISIAKYNRPCEVVNYKEPNNTLVNWI